MAVKCMTTAEFIYKAKSVHGDKYDYSSTRYTTSKSKITITCKEHGDFVMVAARHLCGANCTKCATLIRSAKRATPFSEFVSIANKVHSNNYTYSSLMYKNSYSRIAITCLIHGDFEQVVSNHLRGHGCPTCGKLDMVKARVGTASEFISKSKEVHGDKYDYSKIVYATRHTPVTVRCRKHGDFAQRPYAHLAGAGCPKCARMATANKLSSSTEEFITKVTLLHNGVYRYTSVDYVNSYTKVSITCPVHGEFLQTPSEHLVGSGCSSCAKSGFDPDKPGILYYLKVTKPHCRTLYKIGITNKSVDQRFGKDDLSYITIVWTKEFQNGKDCYNEEQDILKKYKEFKYKGSNILVSGNTELFTRDVLPNLLT